MAPGAPSHRDFYRLQQRRLRAARLFAAGKLHLAAIARELQVSRQSVTRWHAQWKRGGTAALRGAGRAGRKPRLSQMELRRLQRALLDGPRASGFSTDSWTLPCVVELIEQIVGVHYHPGHVWKILSGMHWPPAMMHPAVNSKPGSGKHAAAPSWLTVKRMLRDRSARRGPGPSEQQEQD